VGYEELRMKEGSVKAFLQLVGPFLPENLHVGDDGDNSLKNAGRLPPRHFEPRPLVCATFCFSSIRDIKPVEQGCRMKKRRERRK